MASHILTVLITSMGSSGQVNSATVYAEDQVAAQSAIDAAFAAGTVIRIQAQ
jgi:hypothetical protein